MNTLLKAIAHVAALTSIARGADDIVIADFEQDTYAPWTVTGEAFGPGPGHGTLPDQMKVDGFHGMGLVNSFVNGDDTTGMLTSPEFRIERKYITFLILARILLNTLPFGGRCEVGRCYGTMW